MATSVRSETFDLVSAARRLPPIAPIEHVFVLMLENRSFDHLFGLSGIHGVAAPPAGFGFASGASDRLMRDPPHEYEDVAAQIAGGTMTGFGTSGDDTKLGDDLKQACAQLGKSLSDATGEEIGRVCQALGQATAGAAAFVQQLQSAVNTATAPLGAWLQKYEEARKMLADEIAKVEAEKVALDFSYTFNEATESVLLIEVGFRTPTDAAKALYSAFWSGDLGNYPSMISLCSREGSATEMRGTLAKSRKITGASGFGLQFLGLTGQGTVTDIQQISVTSDVRTGMVIAASNNALLDSAVKMNSDVSETSISIGLEMLGAANVQAPFDAAFKASGDQLTKQNIVNFFAMLEGMKAVRSGTGAKVLSYLFGTASNADSRVGSATFNGKLVIDTNGWRTLLSTTTDAFASSIRQHCMQALSVAVRVDAERGAEDVGAGPEQWVAMWLGETGWDEAGFWARAEGAAVWSTFADSVYDAAGAAGGDQIPHVQGGLARTPYDRSLRLLWLVAFVTKGARQAWPAVIAEQELIASLPQGAQNNADVVFQRLSELSRKLCMGLDAAFEFDVPDIIQPIKVSWLFLGVVAAFANLASPDGLNIFLLRVATNDHTGTTAKYFI
jgi:hypothetical protein